MRKKTSGVVSFLGGFAAVSIVIGIVVYKSPSMRQEAERQVGKLLEVSRSTLEVAQEIVGQVKTITGARGEQEEQRKAEKQAAARKAYEKQWESILF
jgi:hypothetical protein